MTISSRIKRLEKVTGINSDVTDYPLMPVLVETREDVERLKPFGDRLMKVPDEVIGKRRCLSCDEAIEYILANEDVT